MPNESNRVTILGVGLGALGLIALLMVVATNIGVEPLRTGGTTGAPGAGSPDSTGSSTRVRGHLPLEIPEGSGIATSRRHPDTFWIHNDGNRDPRLYAIRPSGEVLAVVPVDVAAPVDWEDLAAGGCPASAGAGDCLYIGDVGDNSASRDFVRILVLREPELPATSPAPLLADIRVRYPEGPADAEGLAVTGSGDVLIVTKGGDGPVRLYRIPAAVIDRATGPGGPDTSIGIAKLAATLDMDARDPADRITGAAVSAETDRLALRARRSIYLYEPGDLMGPPRRCRIGEYEPQGEAIDFLDASTLILTGEADRTPAPILEVTCGQLPGVALRSVGAPVVRVAAFGQSPSVNPVRSIPLEHLPRGGGEERARGRRRGRHGYQVSHQPGRSPALPGGGPTWTSGGGDRMSGDRMTGRLARADRVGQATDPFDACGSG